MPKKKQKKPDKKKPKGPPNVTHRGIEEALIRRPADRPHSAAEKLRNRTVGSKIAKDAGIASGRQRRRAEQFDEANKAIQRGKRKRRLKKEKR